MIKVSWERREAIDKVQFYIEHMTMAHRFNRQIHIHRDEILNQKHDLIKGKLKYDKFGTRDGYLRSNIFDQERRFCYYRPLVFFNKKVISWIIFDFQTLCFWTYGNINELHMYDNHIKPPLIKVTDTNYLPITYEYGFSDILTTFHRFYLMLYTQVNEILDKFNLIHYGTADDYTFYLGQLEFCEEYLNKNIYSLNLSEVTSQVEVHYRSMNHTVYFKHPRASWKNQLKAYEKTPQLLRIEHTFYKLRYPSRNFYLMLQFNVKKNHEAHNTQDLMKDLKGLSHAFLFQEYCKLLKVEESDFDTLLCCNLYVSNRNNRSLIQKLRNKRLIKPLKRGYFIPTERLWEIKHAFQPYLTNLVNNRELEDQLEFEIQQKLREEI